MSLAAIDILYLISFRFNHNKSLIISEIDKSLIGQSHKEQVTGELFLGDRAVCLLTPEALHS